MNKAYISALLTILMWSSLAALTITITHIPSLLSVGLVLQYQGLNIGVNGSYLGKCG